MEKIAVEAYDSIKRNIAKLLGGNNPDESVIRCVDGWMVLNDIHVILQRLYEAGQKSKNE